MNLLKAFIKRGIKMEAVLPILLIITSSLLIITTFHNATLRWENARLKEEYVDLKRVCRNIRDRYQKEVVDCYAENCYLKRKLGVQEGNK